MVCGVFVNVMISVSLIRAVECKTLYLQFIFSCLLIYFAGGGCFKCGSLDHIAKDCTGDPTTRQPHSKYMLKDDNSQRGGDGNAR